MPELCPYRLNNRLVGRFVPTPFPCPTSDVTQAVGASRTPRLQWPSDAVSSSQKTELAVHLGNAVSVQKITMRRNRKTWPSRRCLSAGAEAADDAVLEDATPCRSHGPAWLALPAHRRPEVAATGVKTVLAGYFDLRPRTARRRDVSCDGAQRGG